MGNDNFMTISNHLLLWLRNLPSHLINKYISIFGPISLHFFGKYINNLIIDEVAQVLWYG
jgi:hypothetical protein